MYSAARNCTVHRVDGATYETFFLLEICSELMLPLASLPQRFARSALGTLETCSASFTSSSAGAPTRSSPCRGIRIEAAVTTLSRLAHCSTPPEFRTNAPATAHIEKLEKLSTDGVPAGCGTTPGIAAS